MRFAGMLRVGALGSGGDDPVVPVVIDASPVRVMPDMGRLRPPPPERPEDRCRLPRVRTCGDILDCFEFAEVNCPESGGECLWDAPQPAVQLANALLDCLEDCGRDERCLNTCIQVESECRCGDGRVLRPDGSGCDVIDTMEWRVAVTQYHGCPEDGFGDAEVRHEVFLDGANRHVSGLSGCPPTWPESETTDYTHPSVFFVQIWEADALEDDHIADFSFPGQDGQPGPIPLDILRAHAGGEPVYTGEIVDLFFDYR